MLIGISRGLRWLYRWLADRLSRWIGPRAARALGWIAVVAGTALVVSGVLLDGFVSLADEAFSLRNGGTDEGVTRPSGPDRSGSPESLIPWESLGREGRNFAGRGPTTEQISGFTGTPAPVPIRVYAGLESAGTAEERAEPAVEDLVRAGGFERGTLVVIEDLHLNPQQHWLLAQLSALNKTGKREMVESLLLYFYRVDPMDNQEERIGLAAKRWYSSKEKIRPFFGPSLPIDQFTTDLLPIGMESAHNLQQLFDEEHKHILITGLGGVGKSTLSQKIAHTWAVGKLWNGKFDLVVWVSMRDLLTFQGESLYEFLLTHGLGPNAKEMILAEELKEYLSDNSDKVLFIMDGYDEIASALKKDSSQIKIVEQLKGQDYWIITSRPYAAQDIEVDKSYELVGFSLETIQHYLQNSFEDTPKVELLMAHLSERPSLTYMARIPLVLDALAALWKKNENALALQTISEIFQKLVQFLLQRMLVRMGDPKGWDYSEEHLNESKKLEPLLRFLEETAWKSWEEKTLTISFQSENYKELFFRMEKLEEGKELSTLVKECGFLPAATRHIGFINNEYQFLHPSFQEFFAARHLNRQWRENSPIALRLVQDNKFDARYQNIFAFLAGFLKKEPKFLNQLFEELETPPTVPDIATTTVQVRCLEECWPAEGLQSKNSSLQRIRKWAFFFLNSFYGKSGADYFLKQLAMTPQISQSFLLNLAKNLFLRSNSRSQKKFILATLRVIGQGAPHLVLPILVQVWSQAKNPTESKFVLETLLSVGERAPLLCLAELEKLGDFDNVAWTAIYTSAPSLVKQKMGKWLEDTDSNKVWQALLNLEELPQNCIPKLEKIYQSGTLEIKAKVLQSISKIEKKAQRYAIPLLDKATKEAEEWIRIFAHLKRVQLTEGSLEAVEAFISEGSYSLEHNLIKELFQHIIENDNQAILDYIVESFPFEERFHRSKAIQLLGMMDLDDMQVTQILIQAALDPALEVQQEAIRVLGKIKSSETLHVLLKVCQSENSDLHALALKMILEVTTKQESFMREQLFRSAKHAQPKVRVVALKILEKFAHTGDLNILDLAKEVCEDANEFVRVQAYRILGKIGSPQQQEWLIEDYTKASPPLKVEIVEALGSIGTEMGLPILFSAVDSTESHLSSAAIKSLSKIGRYSAVESVKKLASLLTNLKKQSVPAILGAIDALAELVPFEAIKAFIYCSNSRELEALSHHSIRQLGIGHLITYCQKNKDEIPFLAKFIIQNCFAIQFEGTTLRVFDPHNSSKTAIEFIEPTWFSELNQAIAEILSTPTDNGHFFTRSTRPYLLSQNNHIAPGKTVALALATLDPFWIEDGELEEAIRSNTLLESKFDIPYVSMDASGDLVVKISLALGKNRSFLDFLEALKIEMVSMAPLEKFGKEYVFEIKIKKEQLHHFLTDQLYLDQKVYAEFQTLHASLQQEAKK